MTNFSSESPGEAQRLRWQKALVDSPVLGSGRLGAVPSGGLVPGSEAGFAPSPGSAWGPSCPAEAAASRRGRDRGRGVPGEKSLGFAVHANRFFASSRGAGAVSEPRFYRCLSRWLRELLPGLWTRVFRTGEARQRVWVLRQRTEA